MRESRSEELLDDMIFEGVFPLISINGIVTDKGVLILLALFDGIGFADRIKSIKFIRISGVTLQESQYTLFDGSQKEVSQVLIDSIPNWTKDDIFLDVPYLVLHVPLREEFTIDHDSIIACAGVKYQKGRCSIIEGCNRITAASS